MRRARTLLGWFVVVLTAAGSGTSSAQDAGSYPARPVTVVIPTAASVSGDILMRAFGDAVGKHL
jgi:tripartite-type tricarboxylate transporter receptor subunit TctC